MEHFCTIVIIILLLLLLSLLLLLYDKYCYCYYVIIIVVIIIVIIVIIMRLTNSLDILQAVLPYIFCHYTNPIMVLFSNDHSLVSATMAF